MEVDWLEHSLGDLPGEDNWLSEREALRLSSMRFAKRRADWRLGRWTAKRAVAACLDLPCDPVSLAGIEIIPAPGGAPEVFVAQERAEVTISLSHSAGVAVCAVAAGGVALGCDIEAIEPHSAAFAADYFTRPEQTLVAQAPAVDRPAILTLLWSAKESVLKALGMGLRGDPRAVTVDPGDAPLAGGDEWRPLVARYEAQVFHGWWRQAGLLVRTLVAEPAPAPPRACLE